MPIRFLRSSIFFALAFLTAAFAQDAPQTPAAAAPDIDSLMKTGKAAYQKGEYTPARESLEQAWKIADQLPPKDPKRLDVLKLLVAVDSASGDYKAAQYNQELVINWRENANGQDDPKLVDEWIDMSTICVRLKEFDRALTLLMFARGRHAARDGFNSLSVADDFSREALIHVARSSAERDPAIRLKAVQPLQMAIQLREAVLGAEHPATLPEVDRLASLYVTLRMYDKAEEVFRHAVVIRERLVGPNDPGLIEAVEGLAYAQYGLKEWDDAEKNYKRLLGLWVSATSDPNHPMVALTLDKVVAFYRDQKKWDEAADAEASALAIRGIFLAEALRHEAAFKLTEKKADETIALLKRALSVLDESRPQHQKIRAEIEAALKELAPEDKPAEKPVKPATSRTSTTSTAKATKKQP